MNKKIIWFRKFKSIKEIIIYGVIGVLNTGIHFTIFYLVVQFAHSQAIANSLGFVVAVVFSFYMNAKFTFRVQPTLIKFLKMFVSMLIVSFVFGVVGDYWMITPWLTFIIYCVLNPIIGFLVAKFFVYSK